MTKKSEAIRSININPTQLIISLIILGIIVAVPIFYNYYRNPDRTSIRKTADEVVETVKQDDSQPLILTIPIVEKELDLTIVRKNPNLIMYLGISFFFISIILGLAIVKNIR